jgi:hypothetical protein
MNQPSLADLFSISTIAEIFDLGIAVARKAKLPVDTWQPGDSTRTLYQFLSEYLGGAFEPIAQRYTASAFLSFARAQAEADPGGYPWLVRAAFESHGYIADEATFATVRMTLTNTSGALYTEADLAAGDVSYQNTLTGATYTATTGPVDADDNPVSLKPVSAAPENVVYQWVQADVAGSDSSAGAGEIELYSAKSTIPGVTATNETAAQAQDAETPASIEQGAREQLGPLSPNGPRDAYNAVAKDVSLTGAPAVTRARTFPDSTIGVSTVYLAGPSGAVSPEDVALVEAAIVQWATPGCVTPAVASAVNRAVNITYRIWLYDNVGQSAAEVEQTIAAALRAFFLARPIGGDIIETVGAGYVYRSGIEDAISGAFDDRFFIRLELLTPSIDSPVASQEVPVLGVATPSSISFEPRVTA